MQDAGFAVHPVPGACAAVAALSASGLPTDRFLFEGFLPARAGARDNRLSRLASEAVTLIFYEAPHRVLECLQAMVAAFGAQREAVLAREVTKTFETIRRSSLAELGQFVAGDSNQQKGEIVLLVAGARDEVGEMTRRSQRCCSGWRRSCRQRPPRRWWLITPGCARNSCTSTCWG